MNRKALAKSKRPFAGYFKTIFPCSPGYRRALYGTPKRSGTYLSTSTAAHVMTNARLPVPWGGHWLGSSKRQDVLETSSPLPFGEDAVVDVLLARWLEIQSVWDWEDGLAATSHLPAAYFSLTEHAVGCCRSPVAAKRISPAALEARAAAQFHSPIAPSTNASATSSVSFSNEVGVVAAGVGSLPSLALDVTQGPLVGADAHNFSLRWSASYRQAAQVASFLRYSRGVASNAAGVVGLPPRTVLLLLKAYAGSELDYPALSVTLTLAVAESYYHWTPRECLEVLRCLRRVSLVRALPQGVIQASRVHRPRESISADQAHLSDPLQVLYDPQHVDFLSESFTQFIHDVAPQLLTKIWKQLPRQAQRLCQRGFYLDFIDLLALATEAQGSRAGGGMSGSFPVDLSLLEGHGISMAAESTTSLEGISSSVSHAHYFYLCYVLQLDEERAKKLANALIKGIPNPNDPHQDSQSEAHALLLWRSLAVLVRCVAEALGGVLRSIQFALAELVQVAVECASDWEQRKLQVGQQEGRENCEEHHTAGRPATFPALPPSHLYPHNSSPTVIYPWAYQAKLRQIRLRVIPVEAFPSVFDSRIRPSAQQLQRRQQQRRQKDQIITNSSFRWESPLAAALQRLPGVETKTDRATKALAWATGLLSEAARCFKASCESVKEEPRTYTSPKAKLLLPYNKAVIQGQLDALFTCLPWSSNELELKPLLESTADSGAHELVHEVSPSESHLRRLLSDLQAEVDHFELQVVEVMDLQESFFQRLEGKKTD